ncbi:MAG TPA: chemotaxis protein CheB [Vicinamibacterales bacterium]|nr:chemotaxis protein CheB [Vicinamibacterales bacterium]
MTHDIIVMGASAGGVEALSRVVSELPRDIRASILIVLHVSRGKSLLPEILSRVGRLRALHPDDGQPLEYGRIYVAPPDRHLIVEPGRVRVVHTAAENGVRPSVDPLFRSAARSYGSRVIAALLTGSLDDGTAGIVAVKAAGGITVVQDPEEAFAPGMPRSAIASGAVDHVLPIRDIPVLLAALVDEQAPPRRADLEHPHLRQMEPDLGERTLAIDGADRPGRPSVFTCPECHGTLWEADEAGLLRFRCRVGHVYSPETMLAAQTDEVDRALWTALRTLEERAALAHRLAERARARRHPLVDRAFTDRANESMREADLVRRLLFERSPATETVPDDLASAIGPGVPGRDDPDKDTR